MESIKKLVSKLGAVVRYSDDCISFDYFDKVVILSEGFDKCSKYFKDVVNKHSEKVVFISINEINDAAIFNLIENTKEGISTLGAFSFNWNKTLPIKLGEEFSFNFFYSKPTMEEICLYLDCSDKNFGIFTVSAFDAMSQKCIFHNNLRYAERHFTKHNALILPENIFKISLPNPEFKAAGKKYSVTVKFFSASQQHAKAEIYWNNDYSPHRFQYQEKELFGSLKFFAY